MRRRGILRGRTIVSSLGERRSRARRVWWRAGASLGALALLVGGCAGTEPAEPAEPTAPTEAEEPGGEAGGEPTEEETVAGPPEVDPPEVPDIYREDDQGAQNAAEYFVELHGYIHAGGDLELYVDLSAPDCDSCSEVAQEVRQMHDAGEFHEGGKVVITGSEVFPPDDESPSHLVRVYLTEQPVVHRDSSGAVVRQLDGGDVVVDVLTRHSGGDGHWRIEGVSANAAPNESED